MKKLFFVLAGAAFGLASAFAQQATGKTDLIISEYLEGSSNNKALELYNGTGQDVDLSAYKLVKEINGGGKFSELPLSGTLKAGATFVIANDQSNCAQAIRDLADLLESNKIMNFNGNDAVMLYKGDTKIDVVGVEGSVDNWGMDVTLRRKCDKGPNAVYVPEEWEQLAKDDYSDLGKHCGVDLKAPEVDKILTKSGVNTSVEVYFTKEVTKASAETAANYAIEGLAVSAAVLGEGNKMVTLTTAAMTAGTQYTLVINNVEDASGNKMENVSVKFSFGYAEVADLAALNALRATYAVGQKYLVKGDLVITAIVGKNGSNQNTTNAWVQDKGCEQAMGHSMMLYYVNDLFPSTAKVGDVVSGLVGELTVYNDLIEMQYFDTTMIRFSGETAAVTIDDVTISDLKGANKLQYQNAMVRIKDVEFADAGSIVEANKSYNITDGNGTIAVRTNREGSYLGEKLPLTKTTVVGYVGYYNGNCQISPRTKEDLLGGSVANENRPAVEYAIYPNPTTGLLNVEVEGDFGVSVYSMGGTRLVRRENLADKAQIDLSGLAEGMYLVEIRTAEGMVLSKVVVR